MYRPYDELPPEIKQIYTPEEWAWLPDDKKNDPLQDFCYPSDDYEE